MTEATATEAFAERLEELRPRLHRYCARMTGSVIDGEDVVQDTLLKATAALRDAKPIDDLESWLFRIAHNAAMDFLRRRARTNALRSTGDPEMLSDSVRALDDPLIVDTSLRTFMRLPVPQRSSVILMDVLGYSLEEIGEIMESSIPAVKSALHRGRTRLRQLAEEPPETPLAVLPEPERSLLAAYIERFNARDFGAIREMLAREVQLDVVSRVRRTGSREVGFYFENYDANGDWFLRLGLVDRRPAILVSDATGEQDVPRYFVVLDWSNASVLRIRDFRYARYAMDGAEVLLTP